MNDVAILKITGAWAETTIAPALVLVFARGYLYFGGLECGSSFAYKVRCQYIRPVQSTQILYTSIKSCEMPCGIRCRISLSNRTISIETVLAS